MMKWWEGGEVVSVSRKLSELARDSTLGMSDVEVMERTGLSFATWRRVLQGVVPSDRALVQMAVGLGIDAKPFLEAAHEVRPPSSLADVLGAVLSMSPILLQRFAGHASVTTTLVYARPDDRAVAAEYARCAPLARLRP